MVKTIHICTICEEKFNTFDEAEEHERLPIIEGNYEGKVAHVSGSLDWYGFIRKLTYISPNNHEKYYEFLLIPSRDLIDNDPKKGVFVQYEATDITGIQSRIESGRYRSLSEEELKKVNAFYTSRLKEDSRFPKPTSEKGYQSI